MNFGTWRGIITKVLAVPPRGWQWVVVVSGMLIVFAFQMELLQAPANYSLDCLVSVNFGLPHRGVLYCNYMQEPRTGGGHRGEDEENPVKISGGIFTLVGGLWHATENNNNLIPPIVAGLDGEKKRW